MIISILFSFLLIGADRLGAQQSANIKEGKLNTQIMTYYRSPTYENAISIFKRIGELPQVEKEIFLSLLCFRFEIFQAQPEKLFT